MKETVYSLKSGIDLFRGRLLEHSRAFRNCAILDSFSDKGAVVPVTGVKYDLIAAFGAREMYRFEEGGFTGLDDFIDRHKGQWILGHAGYDLKNEIEKLQSRHEDPIGFGLLCFFVPQTLLVLQGSKVTVTADDPEAEWNRIQLHSFSGLEKAPAVELHQTTGEKEYLEAVDRALHHIRSGDIYEMNFCHEFHATLLGMDMPEMAGRLFARAPGPFSCYYRMQDSHLICASPERFLQKEGSRLLSQPVKGTAARHPDPEQDKLRPLMLAADPKERAENVMIVDLVRNDLSRVAAKGSVQVDELFGVYTFPGAHQMISTVSCTLKQGVTFSAILKALFPMGSMTGAPKIRAMQIIDELEDMRRGLFSGSVGYIAPGGDFDFNVVIRNIQYNFATGYLSLMAGGAITAASNTLNEYRETLVKLQPQFRILGFDHHNLRADA